ncbi:prolyl oligopeptidase family protein [Serratia sp. AKBS12]|uniref:prolyl oligopeptidase family serine peptidase n=1 Tax=Serratia sp. AKBS12 TaxID=2974597 RepID=UPI0021664859|nr:prolyl oligopeptidase family serine peptidase [Serratia sp. AKBS12]MCS3408825.1 prolyl oligopeptidase family serine peptidase [Serratia sp. AKBS12]
MTTLPNSIRLAMAADQSNADQFLWLEQLHSQPALEWVTQQNQRTLSRYAQGTDFPRLEQQVLDILNKDTQIPWVAKYGENYYNFWQDRDNPRGLWRRTTLQEYRKAQPTWETVLDIDALGKTEGQEWVFHGATPLAPDYRYALLKLSPDGGDAVTVREFDLQQKRFVSDGFTLPVAKSVVSWADYQHLFVATYFGPDSLTQSGYPRVVKRWRRGTPLDSAETLYQARAEDMRAYAYHDDTPGFERDFIVRMMDFYHQETFLLDANGRQIKIEVPTDAELDCHREWLLIKLGSDWSLGDKTYPSGALLAANFADYLAGKRQLSVLFTPSERMALSGYATTRDHLIVSIMDDVVNRLEVLTPQGNGWQTRPLGTPGKLSTLSAGGIDDKTNDYFLTVSGFLQPTSLYLGNLDAGEPELLKQGPQDFDASGYQVSQHFARSKDGTRIPYFQIAAGNLKLGGNNPTLLYGYGGFEVSLQPGYLGAKAPTWLERGGVYVVANIRGGGEYGPAWHQAALKQNRHRAYEDFAAVAQDLIARKVTSSQKLAARGGSNGGLLVGNMLTQYPELFGCIVCEVPLLDMQRYTQLSAGASWIAEYGDPRDAQQWAYLQAFSPYHNIKAGVAYPPTLFLTATSDDRVNPSHARKMAARMQQMGYQQAYFYENTAGGHSAAADKKQSAFHAALVSEFIWQTLQAGPAG